MMSDSLIPASDPQALAAQLQRLTVAMDRRALDEAISAGAAGVDFVSSEAQAQRLLRQHLRVTDGAAVAANGKDGAEFVREALGKPEFAHYKRAGVTRGGVGGGTHLPSAHQPAPPDAPEPRTMGEAMLANARRAIQDRQSCTPISACTNMRTLFGLKPLR